MNDFIDRAFFWLAVFCVSAVFWGLLIYGLLTVNDLAGNISRFWGVMG